MHEHEQPCDPNTGAFLLEQLSRFGSDVTRKHEVSFWLYFPSKEQADHAAARIRMTGVEVEVNEPSAFGEWLCLVYCPHIPDEDIFDGLIGFLKGIAVRHQGKFDGWETSLEGDKLNIPTNASPRTRETADALFHAG